MNKLLLIPYLILLGLLAGCSYDLSLEGKRCDQSDHPCPSGYTCVAGDEGSVCQPSGPDGGQPDGQDGDDGGDGEQCQEDELRCSADLSALETCLYGNWTGSDCGPNSYCLDSPQIDPECVPQCDTSQSCSQGFWCNPETMHCEERGSCTDPGTARCNSSLDEVIVCSEESGYDEVVSECSADQYCDPFDPSCKIYCDDDLDCASWPGTSCELASRKCVTLELCASDGVCPPDHLCPESAGACVPIPDADATVASGGTADLDCYILEPTEPPASPPSCTLEGRVVNFFNHQELPDTIGLRVQIHRLSDIHMGTIDNPVASTLAFDDNGVGQYSLSPVPSNTHLVLEVQGRSPNPPVFGFATMYTFGIYLRADDCASGPISLAAPSIFQTNYDGYANVGVVADPNKGLLLGAVRDCNKDKIQDATAGLSAPHETLYYLPSSGAPDLSATATLSSGFFAAANVTPIQGIVSVLARSSAVPVSLWSRAVRIFPQAASLVLFNEPQTPRD